MMKHIYSLVWCAALAVSACKEAEDARTLNAQQPVVDAEGKNPPPEDERVSIPSNITGTHLHCQALLEQESGQTIYKAGCRILDSATGHKIDLNRYARRTDWSYFADPRSNIAATIAVGRPEETYHAIYTFQTTAGQSPELGDRNGAIIATLDGVEGRTEPLVFRASIDALIIEVIDSRMMDAFEPLVR